MATTVWTLTRLRGMMKTHSDLNSFFILLKFRDSKIIVLTIIVLIIYGVSS